MTAEEGGVMAAKMAPASVAGQESTAQRTTMKAIVHHRYGAPPDVLALEETDRPIVGDDDVPRGQELGRSSRTHFSDVNKKALFPGTFQ
jgi:hypothetical protein